MTAAITSALNIGHIDKHVDCEFCQIFKNTFLQNTPGELLAQRCSVKRYSEKFSKIHRKTPALESFY